jgi:hypothetical protein
LFYPHSRNADKWVQLFARNRINIRKVDAGTVSLAFDETSTDQHVQEALNVNISIFTPSLLSLLSAFVLLCLLRPLLVSVVRGA